MKLERFSGDAGSAVAVRDGWKRGGGMFGRVCVGVGAAGVVGATEIHPVQARSCRSSSRTIRLNLSSRSSYSKARRRVSLINFSYPSSPAMALKWATSEESSSMVIRCFWDVAGFNPTRNTARSISFWVISGYSSRSSKVSEEKDLLIFHRLSHEYDMDIVLCFRVNDNYNDAFKQPHRNPSPFAIIHAVVFESKNWPRKDLYSFREIEAMFVQISFPFEFMPRKFHFSYNHTPIVRQP
jgi:hypothetical protein